VCDRATDMHLGRTAATILAPSMRRSFDARLRLVMALLPEGCEVSAIDNVGRGYSGTYVHFGRKAATIWAS
jgi:hypothetical protein